MKCRTVYYVATCTYRNRNDWNGSMKKFIVDGKVEIIDDKSGI